jgi:hypothetical protein
MTQDPTLLETFAVDTPTLSGKWHWNKSVLFAENSRGLADVLRGWWNDQEPPAYNSEKRSLAVVSMAFSFHDSAGLHDRCARNLMLTNHTPHDEVRWDLHSKLLHALLQHASNATHAHWRYVSDEAEAGAIDQQWDAHVLAHERGDFAPSGAAGTSFAMTLLMQPMRGSPTDVSFAKAFAPDEDGWKHRGLIDVLHAVATLHWGHIVRDATYLMPRDETRGYTDDEVRTKLAHLRLLG